MRLPLHKIAEFISASGTFDDNAIATGYSIDSRTIAPGELFFAVQGERLDGHDFVVDALKAGAVAAVVSRGSTGSAGKSLVVGNTTIALQQLAAAVRRSWGKKLIGVTGSAGKTTTKEAIAHVLLTRFRVLKSQGNLNNQFGLPLQLLKLEREHDLAVMELGMSHAGEIAALSAISRPDVGVVTVVAPVHLEFFSSVAEIARAKYELIQSLPPDGIALLNADDEYVSQFGRDFAGKVVTFGLHPGVDVRAERVESRGGDGSTFDLVVAGCCEKVTLTLLGTHNIYNALAAAAAGLTFGMQPSEVAQALSTFKPAEKRGQVVALDGATLVNDCYNSNPAALKAMVDSLRTIPAQRRIVIAGEMLELGPDGERLHAECGEHIAASGVDVLLGVRGMAEAMVTAAKGKGMRAEFVADARQAGGWLARELRPGDAVLLKGSRGVKLEGVLEEYERQVRGGAVTKV